MVLTDAVVRGTLDLTGVRSVIRIERVTMISPTSESPAEAYLQLAPNVKGESSMSSPIYERPSEILRRPGCSEQVGMSRIGPRSNFSPRSARRCDPLR